jgi:radical SAM protein with 4Fe4S-binding SPASM domain
MTSCNSSCVFCPYDEVKSHESQGTMDASLFHKIIDEISQSPYVSEILFELHNEPLLDNRTFEFIRQVKVKNTKKACTLVTNGQQLDRFSVNEIIQSNLDRLIISLNADSPETHRLISKILDYEKIRNNIETILSDTKLRQKTQISYVITEQTADEVQRGRSYWENRGIMTRAISVTNRAGILKNFDTLRPGSNIDVFFLFERIKSCLISIARNITGCFTPFMYMAILYNGDVILCCHDWYRTTVLGNVKETSLKEIWNSHRINEIRKLILKKKYSEISLCKNCSEIK